MSNEYGRKAIIRILMERDGMTKQEAEDLFEEAQREFDNCIAEGDMSGAEDICYEYFDLEPDYLEALM